VAQSPAWPARGLRCPESHLRQEFLTRSLNAISLELMIRHGIEQYVDFLDLGGAPSMNMVARYDDYYGTFEVELWEEGKGFSLYLSHEYDYVLGQERRESLEPALSQYKQD
jgi:hypothetical protein